MDSQSQPVLLSNEQPNAEPAAAFTPGKWFVSSGDLLRIVCADGKRSSLAICGVHRLGKNTGGERTEEVLANAHLIAAAPDLLAVAQWARSCVPYPSDCHTAIVEAIAKATGLSTVRS